VGASTSVFGPHLLSASSSHIGYSVVNQLLHSYALMHCSTALSFVIIILLKYIAVC
jgi:hypothetical protein